jgi:hypothetical protein
MQRRNGGKAIGGETVRKIQRKEAERKRCWKETEGKRLS